MSKKKGEEEVVSDIRRQYSEGRRGNNTERGKKRRRNERVRLFYER